MERDELGSVEDEGMVRWDDNMKGSTRHIGSKDFTRELSDLLIAHVANENVVSHPDGVNMSRTVTIEEARTKKGGVGCFAQCFKPLRPVSDQWTTR